MGSGLWGMDVVQSKNALNEQLFFAARKGDIPKIKWLIANGADVNAQGPSGRTALMVAAYNGRKEVCEFLITEGANLNVMDKFGITTFSFSARRGHKEICKLLINVMIKLTPQERSQIYTLLGLKKRNIPELQPDTKKLIALAKLTDIKREKKQNARKQIEKINIETLKAELLKYLDSIK